MTLAHIRALAEEYAAKYNPDHVAPFPHENVLEAHPDLAVYFTELEDENVSGATLLKDDEFGILINTTKPLTRQHFTLGHELGHYFLHQGILRAERAIIDGEEAVDGPNILYRLDDAETRQLEIEANNFAASLIMPQDLVRQVWTATGSIQKSARIFNVSPVAMSIRLTSLGLVGE